jgi:hypothetical protein
MPDPNPPQDPFEMFRRLWGPLGVPLPGLTMPTLDPKEIEKRIAELKAVESWLSLNLGMLRMAVQGLELQRAALQAMKSATDPGAAQAGGPSAAGAALWPWAALQQAMASGMQNPQAAQDPARKDEKKKS